MTLDELRADAEAALAAGEFNVAAADPATVVALIDSHQALLALLRETSDAPLVLEDWLDRRHTALAVADALTRGDTT